MNTTNQDNRQTVLNRILAIIHDIEEKSLDGDYIYRGEAENYEQVSSTLYRKLKNVGLLHLGVEYIQRSELQHAKEYTSETEELEILTEIQHFGGKTNLIDFTADYRIALFFACNGSPFEDGRVVLQNKNGVVKDWVKELPNPHQGSRPEIQKSVFIRPPDGLLSLIKKLLFRNPSNVTCWNISKKNTRYLPKRYITILLVLLEVKTSVGMFTKNWVKVLLVKKAEMKLITLKKRTNIIKKQLSILTRQHS